MSSNLSGAHPLPPVVSQPAETGRTTGGSGLLGPWVAGAAAAPPPPPPPLVQEPTSDVAPADNGVVPIAAFVEPLEPRDATAPVTDDGAAEAESPATADGAAEAPVAVAPEGSAGSTEELFPLDAFIVPEDAERVPAGFEPDALEHRPGDAAHEMAAQLEAVAHRLRVDGLDAVPPLLTGDDRLHAAIAAVISAFVAGRDG